MSHLENNGRDETLDPEDWLAFTEMGQQMLSDMLSHLETVRERPVWQPLPASVQQALQMPLPLAEQALPTVYDEFRQHILPYPFGNTHPRFWGAVVGTGTPLGMLAEMLAGGMNSPASFGNHASIWVEMQVINWCKEMLGYAAEANGLLVSGTSEAHLLGLAIARNAVSSFDVREVGVAGGEGGELRPFTIYGSSEMHGSVQRAVEFLGLGNQYLRRIPVNDRDEIEIAALRQAIEADLADGFHPICIVGNAGTVNTGAIDNLDALADIAIEYNLWFHIDGAFGALAYLSPQIQPRLSGLQRADSLAFDLHKWLYLPYDIGCLLVRDSQVHRQAFSLHMDYVDEESRGWAVGPMWYIDYGLQVSRSFRALKAWLAFKVHGVAKLGRLIDQNIVQARYLAQCIQQNPQLELLMPVSLNVVCFRFTLPDWGDERLNPFNEELLLRLQESGVALPTSTVVNGRYALRCAITNHRSRHEDFDILLSTINQIAVAMLDSGWE